MGNESSGGSRIFRGGAGGGVDLRRRCFSAKMDKCEYVQILLMFYHEYLLSEGIRFHEKVIHVLLIINSHQLVHLVNKIQLSTLT